ncbi:MAG: ABC transporter permease [Chlamydiota bacterium]
MLLEASLHRKDASCPFGNPNIEISLDYGEALWLRGPSGIGKSSIANHITGMQYLRGADVKMCWDKTLNPQERAGMFFQQGVLIDTLNVKENITLGLKAANQPITSDKIDELIKAVNLTSDVLPMMPGQLSGGMLRRAALAQILAQKKRLVILDEPFVGLDPLTAREIVKTLQKLLDQGLSFIIISHQEQYASQLSSRSIDLVAASHKNYATPLSATGEGWKFYQRTFSAITDYLLYSLPLIILAFLAAGFAINILFSQLLNEVDVTSLLKVILKKHPSIFGHIVYKEASKMSAAFIPSIKQHLFSYGIANLFVIEIGPLLTALLLAGRIGGSYAGKVATMEATKQNDLLRTLGISPRRWALLPSMIAALIAAPILTAVGTAFALMIGQIVGIGAPYNFFPDASAYWTSIHKNLFPPKNFWQWLPVINVYRSLAYIIITMVTAEICGSKDHHLQPRDVPKVITKAVVLGSLTIIIVDWGFSHLLDFDSLKVLGN